MRQLAAVVLVALGLSSCGNEPATPAQPEGRLLTCAGPPFSPAVFDQPADATASESPEGVALRAALEGEPFQPEDRERSWRELGRSEDEVAFGTGDPPVLRGYVVLQRDGNSWNYSQSGSGCTVKPYRPDRTMARWGLDPNRPAPSPDSTSVDLIVNDQSCAGGVGPDERLDDPVVEVATGTVTITFTSRPPSGDQTCPSHPPAPRRVELPEPLGDRELRDGGIYPPQPPCRINGNDCVNDNEVTQGG